MKETINLSKRLKRNKESIEVISAILMVVTNVMLLLVAIQMNAITSQQTEVMAEQRNISDSLQDIEEQRLEYSKPNLICQHDLQEKEGEQVVKVYVSNTGSYPTLIRNITGSPTYNYEYSENKYVEEIATIGRFTFEPPNRIIDSGEQRIFNYTSESDVNLNIKSAEQNDIEVTNRSISEVNGIKLITDLGIVNCDKGL